MNSVSLGRMTQGSGDFPVETRFLLECLRARLWGRAPIFEDLSEVGGFDWTVFIQLVEHHRVISHVMEVLGGDVSVPVPGEVLRELDGRRRDHARRSLCMTAELVRLARLLEGEGIRFLPFKGPLLSQALFGNVAFRTYTDLDVLVGRGDVSRVEELLVANGYRGSFDFAGFSDSRRRLYRNNHNHISFLNAAGDTSIEIHWRLFRGRGSKDAWEFARLCARARSIEIGGQVLRTLGDADLLGYLCVHGGIHLWKRLSWLFDVAEIFSRMEDADRRSGLKNARESGAGRAFLFAALVSHEWLDVEAPNEVREAWRRDRTLPPMLECARREIRIPHAGARPSLRQRAVLPFVQALLTPGDTGILEAAARYLTIPEDWRAVPLPDFFHFLYLPLRPVLLLYRELRARLDSMGASGGEMERNP